MAGRTSRCCIQRGVTNIVVHWRFSEDVCEVTRSEVSPKARKKGHGGRVVEIGALAHARDHFAEERGNAIVDAVADALLRIRCPRLY